MSDKLDTLYRDILMDHYKFPRGNNDIQDPDMQNEGHNPSCGDDILMKFRLDGDKIGDVSVDCLGCAISVASGSMLAEIVFAFIERPRWVMQTVRFSTLR